MNKNSTLIQQTKEFLKAAHGVVGNVSFGSNNTTDWSYRRSLQVTQGNVFQILGDYQGHSGRRVQVFTGFNKKKLIYYSIERSPEGVKTTLTPLLWGLLFYVSQDKPNQKSKTKFFSSQNTILLTWFSWPTQKILDQLTSHDPYKCYLLFTEDFKKVPIELTKEDREGQFKIFLKSGEPVFFPDTTLLYSKDSNRLLEVDGFVYPQLNPGQQGHNPSGRLILNYEV